MSLLTQQAIRLYEESALYGIIHNFQKTSNDDHLIVYRHPISEAEQAEQGENEMRSKNPEKNLRRQRQEQQRRPYNPNGNQRVQNDLGSFLGGESYGGYNQGQVGLPQPNGNQLPAPNQNGNQPPQRINAQPDYQMESDDNSLNTPQFEPADNNTVSSDTQKYINLNNANYYSQLNNNGSDYYPNDQQQAELPNVTASPTPEIEAEPANNYQNRPQLPTPSASQNQQQPTQNTTPVEMPAQEEPEQETEPPEATITYSDADGNTTEREEVPVENTADDEGSYTVDATAPTDNGEQEEAPVPEPEPEEVDNSEEKSRIFNEIQNAINTRKWVESVQRIQIAQKANFSNMPLDHIDLVGITNGESDGSDYRIDLDPLFFKLFKIILIGQNLDITLLARDGKSTEINIAPPDWVQNNKYKDLLIDGNYLYSYKDDLDFDKLMDTLYRFTYRPIQTKGYTELFITDLPIFPVLKDNK